MNELMRKYSAWRRNRNTFELDYNPNRAREEFSKFAGFSEPIPEIQMSKLEQAYDEQMD